MACNFEASPLQRIAGVATGLHARGLPVTEIVTRAGSLTHPVALSVTMSENIVVSVRFVTVGLILVEENPGGFEVQ
jgi:hypothetical protein